MKRPSPIILLMGGGALLNVAMMLNGVHAPAWARYGGMGVLIAMGLTSLVLALRMAFEKKPERPKYQPKRRARAERGAELGATPARERAEASDPPPPVA
jgi:hypothetical protein